MVLVSRKITAERLNKLHEVAPASRIRGGLSLPPNVSIKSDAANELYVLVLTLGPGTFEVLDERPYRTALDWKRPGKTMSFVARHALRTRSIPPMKALPPTGAEPEKTET